MKTTIRKSNNIKTFKFESGDIHKFYNFAENKVGDVLIDYSFIEDFYNFRINLEDAKKGWFLIDLIENSYPDETNAYNLTLIVSGNKIKFEIGDYLFEIYKYLEEYKKYLDDLQRNQIESYIEFNI